MSALSDEIDAALADAEDFAGETVTIRSSSGPGLVYEGTGIVTGGAGEFDEVTGGFYKKDSYTVSVRKSSLSAFVPAPGDLVEIRGKELRIPDDGVTDLRAHYRLTVVGRDSPK